MELILSMLSASELIFWSRRMRSADFASESESVAGGEELLRSCWMFLSWLRRDSFSSASASCRRLFSST